MNRTSFSLRRRAGLALVATLATGALLAPVLGQAQGAYPNKPIHIVVPFPPGGSTDVLARRIGDKLASAWGQPVVVDNRAGAGGTVGADYVAKSAPDGYTLLMGVTGSNAIAQALYAKLPYDVVKDFAPVSMVVSAPLVLAVNPDVKVRTAQEFLALAKSKPGGLSYGSAGNGTSMHLTGEMYKQAAGVSMVHIPYRGSAGMLTDLMSGQIQATFGDVLVLMPQIQAGKLRALAVTSKTRHPMLPDVPTLDEAGLKGFEALSWQGLFAPAGTPPEVVEKLSAEVNKAVRSPDVREYFASRGFIVEGTTPAAFKALIEAEVKKWTPIVKYSGARAD
ncbi:MAG: Bug family tripartite tricarboxylate transporter substrate binding protein [Gammaproteobacteria bacterium]|uniref:Bug family tripartite tricarboxylate transporter substrate binding protein n=1 Tax=unclassified Pseudacidovorax TaxID=2620592 RepID=UPI001B794B7B|nr:tripartite tricarboxylate transporter substrate binding protein [Pseudacidovorax sp.]MBP6895326.1 tripartite tricarboxylate transporter substrate binding protein [Pseudacidovorax sp.]